MKRLGTFTACQWVFDGRFSALLFMITSIPSNIDVIVEY